MMRFSFFLGFLTLAAGCIVEDKPVAPPADAGTDAGELCGTVTCPADRPLCNDLECVQCTADDDDYCTERSLICDVEVSTCTECTGDVDCTDPSNARCDDGMCAPCTDREQCDGVEGLPGVDNACDDAGVCVDCTSETEEDTCPGMKTCHPVDKVCTEITVGALDVCEECVSDSQCGEDRAASDLHRCVPMFYELPDNRFPNDQVGFCLKSTVGGCVQPYSITLSMRTTLSGVQNDDYCGINEQLATCPAVKALVDNQTCEGGTLAECPQPSGLCEKVGDLEDRCTYLCSDPVECKNPPVPGSSCGSSGSGGDSYCGG